MCAGVCAWATVRGYLPGLRVRVAPSPGELLGYSAECQVGLLLLERRPVILAEQQVGGHCTLGGIRVLLGALLLALGLLLAALFGRGGRGWEERKRRQRQKEEEVEC